MPPNQRYPQAAIAALAFSIYETGYLVVLIGGGVGWLAGGIPALVLGCLVSLSRYGAWRSTEFDWRKTVGALAAYWLGILICTASGWIVLFGSRSLLRPAVVVHYLKVCAVIYAGIAFLVIVRVSFMFFLKRSIEKKVAPRLVGRDSVEP